ncbi:MAG: hypothetical protein WDA71_13530 [Actinomycetota bacterium]
MKPEKAAELTRRLVAYPRHRISEDTQRLWADYLRGQPEILGESGVARIVRRFQAPPSLADLAGECTQTQLRWEPDDPAMPDVVADGIAEARQRLQESQARMARGELPWQKAPEGMDLHEYMAFVEEAG